jgi:nitroreductase
MLRNIFKAIFPVFGLVGILGFNCISHAENVANDNLEKKVRQIIGYGSLAPSSHNAQMWKVKKVATDKIRVLIDQQHTLPQVDPENREALVSLGAFIENMALAAPYYDLQAKVDIIARNPNDLEVAEVTFEPKTNQALTRDGLENIKNRHTIRTAYLSQKLREQDAAWVNTFGTELHYFPLSGKEGKYLQAAIVQATQQQVAADNKQKELAGWLRFSKGEAEQTKDGLTPEGMGLAGIVKWFVATFFTRDTVMSKSFRKQTVKTVKKQVEKCSGFVVITAAGNSVATLVNCGRSLERFLIQATGRKLAVQPISVPLEESPWKEAIASKIGMDQTVQMILRVGYVRNYGHPVSKRREVTITR